MKKALRAMRPGEVRDVWRDRLRRSASAFLTAAALLPLAACGSFFQCQDKPACPATGTGTGGTGTGTTNRLDVAFVAYTTSAGTPVITGYNVASGTLTAVNSVNPPFIPVAMAVSANNNFLYVVSPAGITNGGIYLYAISSTGSLTIANSGNVLLPDPIGVGAMTISPDGNYLYTLENTTQAMYQYSTTQGTGALGTAGAITVSALSCAPTGSTILLFNCSVAVSPNNNYLVAALGSQGALVYNYGSTTGATQPAIAAVPALNSLSGDFSVAIDANNYAYIAQTTTLSAYSLASSGVSLVATYTYPTGSIPRSAVVDRNSKYVYTADVGTGKITALTTGTINELSGSPYNAPVDVSALGIDNTNSYLVAAGYSATAGVQLYSLGSTGVLSALSQTAVTSTATQYPVLVSMTH